MNDPQLICLPKLRNYINDIIDKFVQENKIREGYHDACECSTEAAVSTQRLATASNDNKQ